MKHPGEVRWSMAQNILGDESVFFALGGWLHRGVVSYDRQDRIYYFAGEDGQRIAYASTLPELVALLTEKRPPKRVAVTVNRGNVRAIRAVLNAGESLTEFVRVAVLEEVSRRRSEDEEAIGAT